MARTRTRSLAQPDDNIELEQDFEEQEAEEEETEVVSDSRRRRRRQENADELQVTCKDRPTPSRQKRNAEFTSFVERIPVVRTVVAYFASVVSELQKVTWPTRDETSCLTTIVLAVTAFFAISLGAITIFLGWWFKKAFNPDTQSIFLLIGLALAVVIGGTYAVLSKRI